MITRMVGGVEEAESGASAALHQLTMCNAITLSQQPCIQHTLSHSHDTIVV